MYRKSMLVAALLLAAGQVHALERDASQPYRPPGEAQQWMITGRMHGAFKIALRINGEQVFDSSMDGNPSGIYRGKPVRANCTTKLDSSAGPTCPARSTSAKSSRRTWCS